MARKGGIICEVTDGLRKGMIAQVSNEQEPEVVKAKKVRAYFFKDIDTPYLDNGRHVNGLIGPEKLKQIGYYD